jgi:hypothetical protein
MVIEAARSWRAARDTGDPVQPALYAPLETQGCGLLAPALDGVLTMYEAGFQRRFQAGKPLDRGLTGDEHQLLDLLAEEEPRPAVEQVHPGLATVMRIALRSTRIMLRLITRQQIDGQSSPDSGPLFFTQAAVDTASEPAPPRHAQEPGREDRDTVTRPSIISSRAGEA